MNTQAQIALCPDCDRPIPAAAPEGLCPACLAQSAVDEPISDPANTPANQPFANLRFFGDYELIRELGRGAMGVVHLAHQLGVNRPVALKLLAGGAAAGRDFIHRFHTEAATAARLDHPGIVPIYEFGTHDGAYYLAMKYLEGGTLADRLKAGPLDPTEIARIMIRIAQAVHHAHQHGILHRDLKPREGVSPRIEESRAVGTEGFSRNRIESSSPRADAFGTITPPRRPEGHEESSLPF